MRKSNKLVCGLGNKGIKYPAYINSKPIKEYTAWKTMLFRCTEKFWVTRPSYVGTTCSENFKSYTYFYEWCQKQIGFNSKDGDGKQWCLDKDILIKGNKLYSEDNCVFVPNSVNNLLIKSDASRGEYPIGVCWCKSHNKFMVQCNKGRGNTVRVTGFNTYQEAFKIYKTLKESYVKQVAEEYKHQLDLRVYNALVDYQVDIED